MIKRIFDIISSLFGLIFLIPVFLIVSILIKIKTPGPIFFIQERVGRNQKLFWMVKFRTMNVNHSGSILSIKGENRITPLGAILRKSKLDEFPQLWNVFKGDMSIVGPRPDLPENVARLKTDEQRILSMRPGITSPASLKYANVEEILSFQQDPNTYFEEIIFPDKTRIDLKYIQNQSFGLDLKIIFCTILMHKIRDPFWN